ncbi:baseplate assembly protein [Betaproteobacteria bacterium GR16-43]|nr:baseplate assembly protein [Betaproteobacteria bacterium GR16-43]
MNASLMLDLLGRGVGMPLAPDEAGRMARAAGPEKVRQSIFIILDTEPGERVMLPEFGCGLRRFLMQPNNAATRAQIEREATRALKDWEPRIAVSEVDVAPDAANPALVMIEVRYAHLFGGRRDSLVYPFYLA